MKAVSCLLRVLLSIIVICLTTAANSQGYNALIKDEEVTAFMHSLLSQPVTGNKIYLRQQIIDYHVPGISRSANSLDSENTFTMRYNGHRLFKPEDSVFFVEQIKAQTSKNWRHLGSNVQVVSFPKPTKDRKHNSKIQDSLHRMYPTTRSYSIPLFSKDRRKVLIIEAFYCGLACGGGSYNVFEIQNGRWVKIKQFGTWAE